MNQKGQQPESNQTLDAKACQYQLSQACSKSSEIIIRSPPFTSQIQSEIDPKDAINIYNQSFGYSSGESSS